MAALSVELSEIRYVSIFFPLSLICSLDHVIVLISLMLAHLPLNQCKSQSVFTLFWFE